ncbi:hypothetical protein E4U31_007358, partial [Claviceps sp. LM219 group G6]
MAQPPTNDDDLASRVQSLGINAATQIQDLGQEADTENTRLHPYLLNPQLKCFAKYISQDWYESEDEYINLKEASTIQLNDRVICSLHQYLEEETVGKRLYRNACADFADWDVSVWTKVHPEVRKKFRKVMLDGGLLISNNGNPLPQRLDEFIQEGLAALEAGASEASVRSPTGKGKQVEALSNDLLDPNHPKNVDQQFDGSGSSVHTDKASSLTRAHRFYTPRPHNDIATAGPSNQNKTAPQHQQHGTYGNHQQQQHAGAHAPRGQRNFQGQQQTNGPPGPPGQQTTGPPALPESYFQGQQQTTGPPALPGSYGFSGYNGFPSYNGAPVYGFPDPSWNPQQPHARGPPNNYGRPDLSGQQGYSGYDGPFGPWGYPGNTAATNGFQPQNNQSLAHDYHQSHQSRADTDYEDRRFQRCQDTLIKAYTEKDKYTGAA